MEIQQHNRVFLAIPASFCLLLAVHHTGIVFLWLDSCSASFALAAMTV
jgi:hypothetical protein